MYLYKALETLIASKDISNPLQESAAIEGSYPVSDYPTLITDFPVTASSSEGGATATTIEMVVGEKGDMHDSSDSAFNSKPGQRISESVSVSSTAASKYFTFIILDGIFSDGIFSTMIFDFDTMLLCFISSGDVSC